MSYDVVGIGNAIVDVISEASDVFLDQMGIEKGIMQLIDRERAELLYASMRTRTETPGGSVANTIAGLGLLAQAFEALKNRLQAEGLFAPELKKPLPFLPRKIALVTSPTGAAVRASSTAKLTLRTGECTESSGM